MTSERRNGSGRRYEDDDSRLARIETKLDNLLETVPNLITRHEFQPVKAIAYGMVGVLMSALIVLIVASAVG